MADRPVIASPGRGASIALPSLADPAPMVGLGSIAAPRSAPLSIGVTGGALPSGADDLTRLDQALASERAAAPVIRSGLGSAAASDPFAGMYRAPGALPIGVESEVDGTGRPLSLGAAAVDFGGLDQALAEDQKRVAAAAPADVGGGPMGAAPSALQSAIGERDGGLDAIYGVLATPRRMVTKANPLRPIVEQAAQVWGGGGPLQLQPFTPPPIEPGESELEYMQRVQQLQAEDEQRQIQEAGTLGDVRDIGKSGHLGLREAKLQAAEGVGAAELQQQERVAQVQREAAEMSRAATAEARAADQERREFARVQRDAIEQTQAVQADAREKLQALPELDPNRAFKSMDGGAKFWAILGSLAGGMIGSTQVNDRLFQIAQNDLEAQKANATQTFDKAAAADAGVGQQMGLYRELLGAAGDEAAADAMFLQLQLEDAAQMLEAQLAETTVPVLQAQIQESLVGLREQIAQQDQVIQVKLATTPHTFTKMVDPLGPRTRKKLEERAERLEKERTDFQKMGVEGEGKMVEKAYERETKLAEKGMERETKLAEKGVEKDMEIKKAADEWGAVETLIKDFLEANPDEIHGVGAPLTGSQEDRIRTRQFMSALELLGTSGFTGATAADRQAEQIKDMVHGDWTELTDDAARARWGEMLNIASSRRRFYQNELGSKKARISDPEKGLSTFKPE